MPATPRPNILFLLPDQLRPDFIGCYGADFLRTPAIDSLAQAGVRFENAISPSPICVPARASLLTGQHAHTLGVIDNLSWLRPDRHEMGVRSWPELLSQAGYRTAAIGKMHFYPWDSSEGFAQRIIAEDKRHVHIEDDYAQALAALGMRKLHGNDQRGYQERKGASFSDLPDDMQVDRWVARKSCEWLTQLDDDRPFALMVGFPGPHCPYDPPESALARIDRARIPRPIPPTDESRSHRAAFIESYRRDWADLDYDDLTSDQSMVLRHHYAALVERLDDDIAGILATLSDTGRLDNTVVVFASDHGDYLGDFDLVGKTTFHEPSVRVPLILTDFRHPQPVVAAHPVSLLDAFPTLIELAGLAPAPQAQGRSLLATPDPQRTIVGVTVRGVMARSGTHKLVRYRNGTEALFDLRGDGREQDNLIDSAGCRQIRQELDRELTRSLLEGLGKGHADKRVPQAQAPAPHPFYKRGWSRPYPAPAAMA